MTFTSFSPVVPDRLFRSPTIQSILEPVHDVALSSSSLVASRHVIRLGEARHEIPRFLLLGERGGGTPITVGLFAGLDARSEATSIALSRLLLQFEITPSLAKDYALLGYPIVNVQAFDESPASRSRFESRFASSQADEDILFFRSELQQWKFNGHIFLSIDPNNAAFHATTRSRVLAEEVIAPALDVIANSLPVRAKRTALRPSDRYSRLADIAQGKLTEPAGIRPYPFEIELHIPANLAPNQQVTGAFVVVQEILRNYRRIISHGQNL
jgi:hypothetical protein